MTSAIKPVIRCYVYHLMIANAILATRQCRGGRLNPFTKWSNPWIACGKVDGVDLSPLSKQRNVYHM